MIKAYSYFFGEEIYSIILSELNQDVVASIKGMSFKCNECGEKVFLCAGKMVIPHFRHKKGSTCSHSGSSMLDWHKKLQSFFDITEFLFRFDCGTKNRADVFICACRVVEFQNSKISEADFHERNRNYSKYLSLIWLFNLTDEKIGRIGDDNMCYWRTIWPCFRGFESKDYRNVQIYFQISEDKIYKVSFVNNCYENRKFKVEKELTLKRFIYEVKNVGIPKILKKSNGQLKEKIYKYNIYNKDNNSKVFKYRFCFKDKCDALKSDCESCKYHLFEGKFHYCYYKFDDLVKDKEIEKIDLKNNKIYFSDNSSVNYRINDYTIPRRLWGVYFDYEFDKQKKKNMTVINDKNEIYKVELKDKVLVGYKLPKKDNSKLDVIPDYDKDIWKLLC